MIRTRLFVGSFSFARSALSAAVKDLLSSREVENIFENSDFIIMLNQAAGDRTILAKQLNISPHQLSYVTHSGEGEGLLFFGNVILPFVDRFPTFWAVTSVTSMRSLPLAAMVDCLSGRSLSESRSSTASALPLSRVFGNVILPFVDRFPTDLELYKIMTTKLTEVKKREADNG